MKTLYRAISVLSGIAALLSAFLSSIFIVISSPIEDSTTVIGYSLHDIINLFHEGAFGKFMDNLFNNSEYSNFQPEFLLAFISLSLAIIFTSLILIFSLLKKPCKFNIAFSISGLVSLVLSAIGVSAISAQATSGNIDFGKNKLDIFNDFLNIKAINCGEAYFLMGFFLCVTLLISGFYMILSHECKAAKRRQNMLLSPSTEPNRIQKLMIERKYGMFIHFGINTFNDTEWSDGTLPVESYNPPEVDVDSWVANAKKCGMTYIILITKHHDGFCLWNTDTTTYSVKYSPNKTDVVAAAAEACEKYGVQLGLYYSLWDRHEPCYKDDRAYTDYMKTQLTELLDGRYGKICELWFDGGWDKKGDRWMLPEVYEHIKSLQPDIAVGVNCTIGRYNSKNTNSKKYHPDKYKENMPMRYFPSDFRLLDPFFTKKDDPKIYRHGFKKYYLPFEATICVRDMKNWFWDPAYTSDKLVGADFICEKYMHLTSQDNVLVVNVAPNIYGKQEPEDIECLMEAWEKIQKIQKAQ